MSVPCFFLVHPLTVVDLFSDRPADFSDLFHRALSMTLDDSLSWTIRTNVLLFVIFAFQSLDCGIVRKECAPLVSISTWHNLSTERKREELLDSHTQLRKAWRASAKRYDAADDTMKARLRFERSWLYSSVLDFLSTLYTDNAKTGRSSSLNPSRPGTNIHQSKSCIANVSSSSSLTFRASSQLAATSTPSSRTSMSSRH